MTANRARITSWMEDSDIPTPREMRLILSCCEDRAAGENDREGKASEALKRFWDVMRAASQTRTRVSPHQEKMEACRPRISADAIAHAWVPAYTHPSNMHGVEVMIQMIDPSRFTEFFRMLSEFRAEHQDLERPIAGFA